MSHKRIWTIGLTALLACIACLASFWAGKHVGQSVASAAQTASPGALSMTDASQTNPSETPNVPSEELACGLTPSELNAQRKQLIPGLFQRAELVEDIPSGLRFRFAHKPKLVSELAALIEKEQVCCSFLSFRLLTDKGDGPITLEVTGPPGTAEMLRKL